MDRVYINQAIQYPMSHITIDQLSEEQLNKLVPLLIKRWLRYKSAHQISQIILNLLKENRDEY